MDLPPSGWYPDPYATPGLLRWWDGSAWTQHTHPDVTAGGAGTGGSGGEPATRVHAAPASTVQPAARQATALQATAVQATALQATAVQPSADRLRRTGPPTGRRTEPQPALPPSPGPTGYQPAVTAAAPGTAAATAFQPVTVQPGYPQPSVFQSVTGAGGGLDRAGTQVLYPGADPWPLPAAPAQPAGPGGPGAPGNPYGYLETQRRRGRRRLIIGITVGTVAAVAAIALIAASLTHSPASTAADQAPASPATAPSAPPASAVDSASASPSPTASASPSATATGSLLTDGQSGLSYAQLPSPWQDSGCAPSLDNGAFTWTAGEYATAGQIDGGSMPWYGEACSGPLPSSYGYTSTEQLQTITENLAQTFENAYYDDLDHNVNPEQDQSIQVGGHEAWEVSYDVVYTNPGQESLWNDEQATVVVVDNGTDEPAVFFTSIPQDLNEDNGLALVQSLTLTAGAAAPTASPAAADPAASGDPDGGD